MYARVRADRRALVLEQITAKALQPSAGYLRAQALCPRAPRRYDDRMRAFMISQDASRRLGAPDLQLHCCRAVGLAGEWKGRLG